MREFRKRLCSALALVALAGATSAAVFGRTIGSTSGASETSDSFAGVWRVTVSPDSSAQQSGKQEFNDEILFEDGKMTAAACASYGFGESSYELTNNGTTLNSTMTTDGESIAWSANLVSGRLQGSVIWSKPNGATYHYSLRGDRSTDSGASEN